MIGLRCNPGKKINCWFQAILHSCFVTIDGGQPEFRWVQPEAPKNNNDGLTDWTVERETVTISSSEIFLKQPTGQYSTENKLEIGPEVSNICFDR